MTSFIYLLVYAVICKKRIYCDKLMVGDDEYLPNRQ